MNLTLHKQTMSSREIADYTGKMHKHVLDAIRNMEQAWESVTGTSFRLSEYTDPTGRKLPMYELSKKECLYIATKFNDEARAKLILRWEELENQKIDFSNPDTVLQLAQNWKNEQVKRLDAERKVKLLTPKAELMQRVLDTDTLIDIGQAAKILGLPFGRNILFQELRKKGILFKGRNEPMQEYINRGYFILKEKFVNRVHHESFVVVKVLVTQKGLEFLSNLFHASPGTARIAMIN